MQVHSQAELEYVDGRDGGGDVDFAL